MGLYDAIVVGAGPAGLAFASFFSGKTLLIEKHKKPWKRIACAEWVPPGLDIEPVQSIRGMVTVYPGGEKRVPFRGFIVDREKWQRELLDGLSCEVHLGEKVIEVKENEVVTDRGTYRGEWIIGTDGPLSVVRKGAGLPPHPLLPAVNVRVPIKKPLEDTWVIFSSEIPGGYGWCFPKGEFANVGAGAYPPLYPALKFTLDFFLKKGFIKEKIIETAGGFIPLGGVKEVIKGKIILCGDAGGFTDPLTGAGIQYAWESGKLAAGFVEGKIHREGFEKEINAYRRFIERRKEKRKILEEGWENLKEAVERSWIAFSRG